MLLFDQKSILISGPGGTMLVSPQLTRALRLDRVFPGAFHCLGSRCISHCGPPPLIAAMLDALGFDHAAGRMIPALRMPGLVVGQEFAAFPARHICYRTSPASALQANSGMRHGNLEHVEGPRKRCRGNLRQRIYDHPILFVREFHGGMIPIAVRRINKQHMIDTHDSEGHQSPIR